MRQLLGVLIFSVIMACILASMIRNESVDVTSKVQMYHEMVLEESQINN